MTGGVAILNIGAGDIRISFDPKNPAERIRAARVVTDMLRRGYALLVETKQRGAKAFQRVHRFDEKRCEYVIADLDPITAHKADEAEHGKRKSVAAPAPRGTRKIRHTRIKTERTHAVAIGPSAGG